MKKKKDFIINRIREIFNTDCISISRLIRTFTGFNGRIIAPNKIHVNITPANISMPTFQPSLVIKILAIGPKDKTPIPVPAVTKPKINKLINENSKPINNFTISNRSFFIKIK